MLEDYVEKWPTPHIENFRYMLRSGMMGWLTIMLDTTAWTDEQHAVAKDEFEIYKTKLRPFDPRCGSLPYFSRARRNPLGRHGIF